MSESHDDSLTLEELDRDGALQEAIGEVGELETDTRSGLLRKTGAFVGGGLLLGAVPLAIAGAQGGSTPQSDVTILNFALTLEYLESTFYQRAIASGKLSGELATFAQVVAGHESQHVAALTAPLGSKAKAKPSFDFKGTTSSQKKFAATSQVLEDTGVSAYQGQATNIKTPAVLMAAGSILPVEARHAAWIRDINGRGDNPSPAPDAFSPAKSMSEILSAVKATGFIKG